MPNYHRFYLPNSFIFITSVTKNRTPYFSNYININIFTETVENVKRKYSFELFAYVLLPDHFHWIIKMPENDTNFSKIVHSVKRNFTINYKKANGINYQMNIWQPRFWDHVIRDEQDLKNHLDYLHWNPVKHEIANQPDQYRYSSFQSFVKRGVYPEDYALQDMPFHVQRMEFE